MATPASSQELRGGRSLAADPTRGRTPLFAPVKRCLDVIVSLGLLILLSPFLLVIAGAIKLDSPGPVFFSQKRIGRGWKAFRMLKLRTMIENAESIGPLLAVRNDSRVTRVGRFLRCWSIDEIPQFLNVVKGEMSLVGPRPELPSIVRGYTSFQQEVLTVRPGITGFSQVHGRDDVRMARKLRLDVYYVRHHSLGLDLWILIRTIKAVSSQEGAF